MSSVVEQPFAAVGRCRRWNGGRSTSKQVAKEVDGPETVHRYYYSA
jgi:hypothetical protein